MSSSAEGVFTNADAMNASYPEDALSPSLTSVGGRLVWLDSEVVVKLPCAILSVQLSIAHPLARHFAGSAVSVF